MNWLCVFNLLATRRNVYKRGLRLIKYEFIHWIKQKKKKEKKTKGKKKQKLS